jgi:DNA replication protein DnaC
MEPDMNWEQAIKFFNIPKDYHRASLENADLLPRSIIELGKRWVEIPNKPPLYLRGIPGSGKTYFSYAVLRELFERGHREMIFVTSKDLDDELLRAFEEKQELSKIQKYQEVALLFLDDIGTERECERIIRQYSKIIEFRCANKMTSVYNSNLTIDQLKKSLGDRICSRLAVSHEFIFPDKDLRTEILLPPI